MFSYVSLCDLFQIACERFADRLPVFIPLILDFSGTEGDFQFSEQVRAENVNIGVSLMKGNTELKEAIDGVLSGMTVEDFNAMMEKAISIQPLSE